jgi:chemosensory pili system protein ChpA (sensor histidine kinase/response regulator)
LAWVIDDLRKSLGGAATSIRRFVWDTKSGPSGSVTDLDTSDLRMARRQFHQSAGALEMVGQQALAKVLRAMETLTQKFVQWPDACTEDAAQRVENASRALVDYLEGALKGGQTSPVALFPQQRALMELAGAERIHPADLWPHDWQWAEVSDFGAWAPLHYEPTVRGRLGDAMLPVIKTLDRAHATQMAHTCAGLATGESALHGRSFWAIAAGFFEAIALGLLPDDVYVRRTAARVLPEYGRLTSRQKMPSERVAQDMLFYCAIAHPVNSDGASVLCAVRSAFLLNQYRHIDYEASPFGRFDPAQLAQARSRLGAAAETWSALAGGDLGSMTTAVEQFAAVREAISKLHTENAALVAALSSAVNSTARTGAAPTPAIAVEVATSILYLEAVYDDLDLANDAMAQRGKVLAARLQNVCTGGASQPIEAWMEQLYRRVSDRQTMGTVTLELRSALAEVEKAFDRHFRNPGDLLALQSAPVHLGQMRGVFSVLGLDQAALATLRIRSGVEQLLAPAAASAHQPPVLSSREVNSLSAIGFLIDMLAYQPLMAKELFLYDEQQGEFRMRMQREGPMAPNVPTNDAVVLTPPGFALSTDAFDDAMTDDKTVPAAAPANLPAPGNLRHAELDESEDDELQDIFLSEASGVVRNGLVTVAALAAAPDNVSAQATLRRAFHTLKGSARMVGNHAFGDAAWALEQLLNTALSEQRPADERVVQLCHDALRAMSQWIEDLSAGQPTSWDTDEFQKCADSLRQDIQFQPVQGWTRAENLGAPADAGPAPGSALMDQLEPIAAPQSALGMGETGHVGNQVGGLVPEGETSIYLTGPEPTAATDDVAPMVAIGDLRLSQAFFDVFMFEASDWSQRLLAEITHWDPQTHKFLPAAASSLAHSLQGSAAAVGFSGLSALARALEQALDHLRPRADCSVEEQWVFCSAAQDIIRLLDGFSQRTLLEADPVIFQALKGLLNPAPAPLASDAGDKHHAEPLAPPTDAVINVPDGQIAALGKLPPAVEDLPSPLPLAIASAATVQDAPTAAIPPALVPVKTLQLQSPEFDSEDALDVELLPIFMDEGRELLPTLSTSLQQWVAQPEQVQYRAQALRTLHTLKGSARLAGALRLGEQAHRMESIIEKLGLGPWHVAQLEPCLGQLDQLNTMFDALDYGAKAPVADSSAEGASEPSTAAIHQDTPSAALALPPGSAAARALNRPSVRVRSQILDRLIDQASEVMVSRSRLDGRVTQLRSTLGELGRNLDRLRHQLRDLELQADLQMQSRVTQPQETAQVFDPLEFDRFTRVQEVSRMMAESVSDIETLQRSLQSSVEGAHEDLFSQGRRAKELQNDLLRMRLIEFEGISDRLYGVVRQASKDTGKQIRLDIVGGGIEIDRGMLDRMTPAFEHLLRNAVAHGIEPPAVRQALGKIATGAISIKVEQDGSDVSVTFSDDGGGLQIDKIRDRAVAAALWEPDQPLSLEEAARLLFIPGFSTADQVTEVAGRGIGMDVVLSDVSAVGGRIECASQSGKGTSFKVVFPLTTAVTQVVMLRIGTVTVGVPANLLETVIRLPASALGAAYASASFAYADQAPIPFFWAGALFNVSSGSQEVAHRQHAVALIRSAGQRVALHVDEVLGNREVVVKNLGPQLSGLPGLAGMSVLASGAVVLIYNPVALVRLYGDGARGRQVLMGAQRLGNAASMGAQLGDGTLDLHASEQAPLVLVVDDSITVRRVTQRLLKREGFRVVMAMDGLQALEVLREERPVVVVSDIEMPRMDGLDLTRNIRRDAALANLPIIMITSRIAQKHRDHAAALGVNHYLGKPYSEAELVGLVRSYCAEPATA